MAGDRTMLFMICKLFVDISCHSLLSQIIITPLIFILFTFWCLTYKAMYFRIRGVHPFSSCSVQQQTVTRCVTGHRPIKVLPHHQVLSLISIAECYPQLFLPLICGTKPLGVTYTVTVKYMMTSMNG